MSTQQNVIRPLCKQMPGLKNKRLSNWINAPIEHFDDT